MEFLAMFSPFATVIHPDLEIAPLFQHFPAQTFPSIHPAHWLHSHFAVGGWSPLQRLSGMLTAHMTQIAPRNGFTWHPHKGLEIYTWVIEGQLYHEDTTGGKGIIKAGELQRMFSGNWIEHQELNMSDEFARVIQIWFAADPAHRGVEPHYQQLGNHELPKRIVGDATVHHLIGDGSPMQQHVDARLTATTLRHGTTELEAPHANEDLFLYVTDGAGTFTHRGLTYELGQYDVMLARPDTEPVSLDTEGELHFMSFYLPAFLG